MNYVFSKSKIGYSHIKDNKKCQDYSASYIDPDRTIITCCDGHGGNAYIRSNLGSKFTSDALITVLKNLTKRYINKFPEEELINKIKLDILCEWNRLVESHYSRNHFKASELKNLSENIIDSLRDNFSKAYGTTMSGAMLYDNKLFIVNIGDTECLLVKDGKLIKALDTDEDPVANVTYSMCQENAFKYLRVSLVDFKDYDGIILCTDGLSSPYQSYDNFNKSFITPMVRDLIKTNSIIGISSFIDDIALKFGVGDDVSLSFIFKDKLKKKYYK